MEIPYRKSFLVLEDDANDAVLIRRAFTKAYCEVFVCRNTSEARAYLHGAGMYADRERFPFPDILLTDMRLGEESGAHFIQWMRSEAEFREIEVIVLSGAASPEEVRAVRRLGVKRVLQKAGDFAAFSKMLAGLADELCEGEVEFSGEAEFSEAADAREHALA